MSMRRKRRPKLRPCPFCAGEAQMLDAAFVIECASCQTTKAGDYETQDDAAAAWNVRRIVRGWTGR
jgi:ribosomal protein L37AE/L43A